MFARLYERLGPRYPTTMLATALRLEYAVVILGAVALAFYVSVSFGEFLALAALGVVGQELYAQFVLRYFRPRLQPVADWIDGAQTAESTIVAWRAAASAPFELLRFWWRGGYPLPAGLAWSVFAVWLL